MTDVMKKLQAPFKPDEIEWRVGSTNSDKTKGLALAYITNRAIQNRLDETFGVFGWKNEFHEWKGQSQICGISIKDDEGEWITKWDGADNSNMEGTKGGLSDAMKRAAYQWGIGRYLYNLPSVWMPLEKRGNTHVLAKTPILPEWALPENYEGKQDEPRTQSQDALDVFDTPITDDDVPKETKKYASQAQKNFIDDLTEQRKIPSAGLEEILEERYGIKSKEELTTKEASDLIEFIKNG